MMSRMAVNTGNSTISFLFGNSTNTSQNRMLSLDRFDTTRTILLSLQILVVLVGSVGNVIVCIITSRKRSLKVVGNRFILNLAIADLGILVTVYPHRLTQEFSVSWPFGEFICKTVIPFIEIFYGAGIGCITAIALHRYRMLVHCMKPQMNAQTAKRMLFFIWLLSFIILVMPLFFVMKLISFPKIGISICQPIWPTKLSRKMYDATCLLAFYICPLGIISVTYIRIRTKLKDNIRKHDSYKRTSFRADDTAGKSEVISRIGQNRRALRLLAPVVIFFAVCLAPVSITALVSLFLKNPRATFSRFKHMPTAFRIFTLLLNMNSSVNPIIYSVVNTEFRREFKLLLRCDTESCCADTTEGLGLETFRKSSSVNKSRDKRGSFLLNRRGSSSSRKCSSKSSSRNSADKAPGRDVHEQVEGLIELVEKERKIGG